MNSLSVSRQAGLPSKNTSTEWVIQSVPPRWMPETIPPIDLPSSTTRSANWLPKLAMRLPPSAKTLTAPLIMQATALVLQGSGKAILSKMQIPPSCWTSSATV
jgi:hypothetical protein